MSAYTTCKTDIMDKEVLIETLNAMGYKNIEEHETEQKLVGYTGDTRQETAHVIIRKRFVGGMSNDIGFRKVGDRYEAVISDYDNGHGLGKDIRNTDQKGTGKFMQEYAKTLLKKKIHANPKYRIIEEIKKDDKIQIRVKMINN